MDDLACIGLGSNLGDRLAYLRAAVDDLAALDGVAVESVSSAYESDPVGYVDQPPFLNAAATLRCELAPADLLAALMAVEQRHGRQRTTHWGPRTLDLDLLHWGGRIIDTVDLQVPHPRMLERIFVIVPLLEIAPTLRHAATGRRLADHAAELGDGADLPRVGVLRPAVPDAEANGSG